MRKWMVVCIMWLGFVAIADAQDANNTENNTGNPHIPPAVWVSIAVCAVGFVSFIAGRWDRARSRQNEKERARGGEEGKDEFQQGQQNIQQESDRERYENTLREELGSVRMLGSPDIPNVPVSLLDTFVSMDISTSWRTDHRFGPEACGAMSEDNANLNPNTVMQRAFQQCRMLVLIGDPGSGKTTLMKYYAMCCLTGDFSRLGFDHRPLPIYLPLRKVSFVEGQPDRPLDLHETLKRWADDY